MPVLYVSDLDGTLLRSNETVSAYTCDVINRLTEQGMLFSYATARSYITAQKVTHGICAKLPLIVYNGALVIDSANGEIMLGNYFDDRVQAVLTDLFAHGICPIVYAFVEGVEKFSFVPALCTRGMDTFLDSRKGDIRTRAVHSTEELRAGRVFYLACIDTPEKLEPFYQKYRDTYHCVYQRDIYSGEQWLEIMPQAASKANAIAQLKKLLRCDRLVVFGDGKNDIDMFRLADERYAVENAHDDLKRCATGIIPANNADGVAHWLEQHFQKQGG